MSPLATFFLAVFTAAQAAGLKEPPRVALLSTGGTIDMRGARARSADRPALWVGQAATPVFPAPLDSSQIGPAEWKQIIAAVEEHAAAPGVPAVLKHGTDTLEQTGLALSLVFDGRLRAPVVLTGSWAPPDQPGSDAKLNLARAHSLACAPGVPPLVYAVLGDEIHLASRVKKTRTTPEGGRPYFESPAGPVGRFDAAGLPVFSASFLRQARRWRGLGLEPGVVGFAKVAVEAARAGVALVAGKLRVEAKDIPGSLDPVRAALKLSMLLASPVHAADALSHLLRDVAGEVQPARQAILSLPLPKPWPRSLELVVATQDLDGARIVRASRRLIPGLGPGPAAPTILEAVAWAVRGGVDVVMATNAWRSPTDLTAYEIGEQLAAAGARDSGGKPLAELLRERPRRPRLVIVGTGSGHLRLR
jgi:L-asparaginase/Glu-tRNA(Gln) amidotransferase subunit D